MTSNRTIRTIRRPVRTALAVLAVAAASVGAVAVPSAAGAKTVAVASTTCPTGWGSLPKANTFVTGGILAAVRTGRHACFDRVVFDIAGTSPGYGARYVPEVYHAGAGHLVPLRGRARLEILLGVREFDDEGHWAYQPPNESELANVTGYRTLRQIAYAGSTGGAAWVGIGLRARLPYRIYTLPGPGSSTRVVVDVAHSW